MTDKVLFLGMDLSRDCGTPPARAATFIIDWTGTVRYMIVHRSDIGTRQVHEGDPHADAGLQAL